MITNFQIKAFKSHLDSSINFLPLTVFTGQNGAGKSSIIQSLLLLRQSFLQNVLNEGLSLNGDLVEIGVGSDALATTNMDGNITFSFQINKQTFVSQTFKAFNPDSDFLPIDANKSQTADHLEQYSLFNSNFQYIGADRPTPQDSHGKNTLVVERRQQISFKKGQGEYMVHYLSHYSGNQILPQLQHPNAKNLNLRENVNAWLGEISKGVHTVIEYFNNSYSLKFKFEQNNNFTPAYTPQNVGFGISYALPVVLALLATTKDGLVLLENPEAHIHPSGQAKLAELIALAAQAGVQVVVETHSDHLINGILVACKKFAEGKKGISPDNVAIYYIDRDENSQDARTIHVPIVDRYYIEEAPAGFFDQFSIDLDFLTSPIKKQKNSVS